jgi:hypothetical protein
MRRPLPSGQAQLAIVSMLRIQSEKTWEMYAMPRSSYQNVTKKWNKIQPFLKPMCLQLVFAIFQILHFTLLHNFDFVFVHFILFWFSKVCGSWPCGKMRVAYLIGWSYDWFLVGSLNHTFHFLFFADSIHPLFNCGIFQYHTFKCWI